MVAGKARAGSDSARGRRLSGERVGEGHGLLEVGGVKAFGEPGVDRGQQVVGFSTLVLVPPQACQAHDGAQLQRLRLLAAGNPDGLEKTAFRLSVLLY